MDLEAFHVVWIELTLIELVAVGGDGRRDEHHVVADVISDELDWPVELLGVQYDALVVRCFEQLVLVLFP